MICVKTIIHKTKTHKKTQNSFHICATSKHIFNQNTKTHIEKGYQTPLNLPNTFYVIIIYLN